MGQILTIYSTVRLRYSKNERKNFRYLYRKLRLFYFFQYWIIALSIFSIVSRETLDLLIWVFSENVSRETFLFEVVLTIQPQIDTETPCVCLWQKMDGGFWPGSNSNFDTPRLFHLYDG
jgi:hypothetical protein